MLSLTFSIILILLPSLISSLCYFPDGSVASGDSPCSSEGNSTCCGRGFACLSNNVCMLTDQVVGAGPGQSKYIRGSCTDKSWNDPRCPQFCLSTARGDCLSCAMGMEKCPNTNSDVYYCQDVASNYGQDANAVSSACGQFTVAFKGIPTPLTTIGYTTSVFKASTTSTTSLMSSSTESTSSVTIAASTTPSESSSSQRPQKNESTLGIGIGLGVGLGLIAVAIFTYLCLRNRRASSRKAASPPVSVQYHETDFAPKSYYPPPQQYAYEAHPKSPNELPGRGSFYNRQMVSELAA